MVSPRPGALAQDFWHAYFLLGYAADIQYAIEKDYTPLRWGSGAMNQETSADVELDETTNVFRGASPLLSSGGSLMEGLLIAHKVEYT